MDINEALGMAGFVEVLAAEVRELRERTEVMKKYIEEASERHDQLVAELDDMIQGGAQEDVQKLHDRVISEWPKKPYFMRMDW